MHVHRLSVRRPLYPYHCAELYLTCWVHVAVHVCFKKLLISQPRLKHVGLDFVLSIIDVVNVDKFLGKK
jgi:hypothetical protein